MTYGTLRADAIESSTGLTLVQSSSSKVLTLGGNLTTSGAYACTLTLTGTTNVTLPTSGTLATTTSVGTLTTGTWNADIISGQYGGTGVNNSGKTITLGGNLTTSGAYACTLTLTGATNVTLPTTGTLATTAGVSTTAKAVAVGFDIIFGF